MDSENNKYIVLLHEDVAEEIRAQCRTLIGSSNKIFSLAQEMVSSNEKPEMLSLQQAASLVNMMTPVVRIADFVNETNMRMMKDHLEEMLVAYGAQKTEIK